MSSAPRPARLAPLLPFALALATVATAPVAQSDGRRPCAPHRRSRGPRRATTSRA
jgi:hypothetical protein